jgi:single-strand DNA-binding protein
MNNVTIIGRFAADPELKTTGSGIAVTSFTLAVDRPYKKDGDKVADWIDFVAWRNTAEFVCKYFRKGDPIVVEGALQSRYWEDKNEQKHKAIEVVAENVEFAPKAKGDKKDIPASDDFTVIDDDDLPF